MWSWSRFKASHHFINKRCSLQNTSRCLSTVYALSSGQGKCGVALVRVTGDKAREVFTRMTVPPTLPEPRMAVLRRIVHPATRDGLDRGIVLWFPAPNSFTGEDSCELHIHGGSAVISAVLGALSSLPGYYPAQPGDFTKRAFYNGKLDLTEVEGLGDLIHAETEAQRKQALQQMEGALGQLYTGWRQVLLHCRANIEAFIDFSEDENIQEGVVEDVEVKVRKIIKEMEHHLSDNRRGERLRSGLQLAILGRPNVGKSSFLNALVQRPAAIVSPVPGTTRDVIETTIDMGGYPIILSDTAGLRDTDDIVETEGIKRALARSRHADVAVIILEATEIVSLLEKGLFNWDRFIKSYFAELGIGENEDKTLEYEYSSSWISNEKYVILLNKVDLIVSEDEKRLLKSALEDPCFLVSMKTEEGIENALLKLKHICASLCESGTAENPTLTATRHRTHISACLKSLKLIINNYNENNYHTHLEKGEKSNSPKIDELSANNSNISETAYHFPERETPNINIHSSTQAFEEFDGNLLRSEETLLIAAHHLQKATNHLGYVTGHITTEDILDHIFSAFCIGK
ncbi:tRNA modification GTPase gtpbp3, mitochondrial [Halocaridina rubra]|uniref:tRNA modification GTPase gtpbp3, mitochondrial n=1 Tax=Halocaridina rubra TaxID=373956 RepID=A0AAN8X7T6_HALRR